MAIFGHRFTLPVLLVLVTLSSWKAVDGTHLNEWRDVGAGTPTSTSQRQQQQTGPLSSTSSDRRLPSTSYNADNAGSVSSNNNPNAMDNTAECLSTQRTFVARQIGEASLTLSAKTHDPDMSICYDGKSEPGRRSCCSETMERHYKRAAQLDLTDKLRATGTDLADLMKHNVVHYQDLFLSLIEGAHNRTERLFSEVYHLPLIDRWGLTESLFLDLQAFIRNREVSIDKSLETFFDQLFPLVYHNNVIDPLRSGGSGGGGGALDLDSDYSQCLSGFRRYISPAPFGTVPGRLEHLLTHTFRGARSFLDALELGASSLDHVTQVPLDEGCREAITRLEYCGHCEGHSEVYPCRTYCHNVMRGCLVHTSQGVHQPWVDFVDGLEALTLHMRQGYDLETVLRSVDTKISEAIMHAMETGVKFSRKVNDRCGHLQKSKTSKASARGLPGNEPPASPAHGDVTLRSTLLPAPLETNTRLVTKMEMFMRNIVNSRDFFDHLPERMCTDSRFSSGLDSQCWNGQTIGMYNKTVVSRELASQIQNPEMNVPQQRPAQVTSIIDDLQTMTKTLASRVVIPERFKVQETELPQGDDPNVYYGNHNYGDPSGDWGGPHKAYRSPYQAGWPDTDDEDWYNSGSGSGSVPYWKYPIRTSKKPGAGNLPDDITFDKQPDTVAPPYQPNPPRDGNYPGTMSAVQSLSISIMTGVLLLVHYVIM